MRSYLAVAAIVSLTPFLVAQDASDVGPRIRAIALEPNDGPEGRPLPLFASWNTGGKGGGYSPAWQLEQLDQGRPLLPWLALPEPGKPLGAAEQTALAEFAKRKLPVAFLATQWERLLTADKRFASRPKEANANVFDKDGKFQPKVSPFSPIEPWSEIGALWGASPAVKRAQEIHPDPPRIFFHSNNEHTKIRWHGAEEDSRFVEKFGEGKDDAFKRKATGDGWIERYRALQKAFRENLEREEWRNAARFVGYNAFAPESIGRWVAWDKHSLHAPGRISPWPLAWDGGAPSFYTNNWDMSTDYTVFSPQVQCMTWVPALADAWKHNPDFWFELSLWDGAVATKKDTDKRRYYADRGQKYSPERYAGMAKFGLWMLRPRVIREFRGYLETRDDYEAHSQAVLAAVHRIHSPPLAEFWRKGKLVPNTKTKHPMFIGLPPELEKADRWFRLDAEGDPTGAWKLGVELDVFALALELGEKPERRWLVYAHAPRREEPKKFVLTLPGYGKVSLEVGAGGVYAIVSENGRKVEPLER
ncbi:MAG TPA: hypothetical protein VNC50_21390 [Planctomycetia bacterium]|nr:hypothetical protein [Planctomycetia bacterium]